MAGNRSIIELMIKKTPSLIMILVLLVLDVFLFKYEAGAREPLVSVSYLDVGQGDSILIESTSGNRLLIDTGKEGTLGRPISKLLPFFDRKIDVLLLTHSDTDHIGGALEVLNNFEVAKLFISGDYENGELEKNIISLAKEKNVEIIEAVRGQIIDLGGEVYATILFPDRKVDDAETNTASVGLKLTYGDVDFILTGDMPSAVEDYLVSLDGKFLDSEVLKLGHHGSKTSTSKRFLQAVSPEHVIISAGKNNSYGHPHKEVLEKVKGIDKYATYERGTISFKTDGLSLWTK
jgi:competence protein ComEC